MLVSVQKFYQIPHRTDQHWRHCLPCLCEPILPPHTVFSPSDVHILGCRRGWAVGGQCFGNFVFQASSKSAWFMYGFLMLNCWGSSLRWVLENERKSIARVLLSEIALSALLTGFLVLAKANVLRWKLSGFFKEKIMGNLRKWEQCIFEIFMEPTCPHFAI